jgi:8-oxo-dGTP pyrophosphatase MutT (NUDIX family)
MKTQRIETIVRGVCILRRRVLVCHTRGAANVYLPGGHIEFGERSADALSREIKEELGLEAQTGAFLGVVEHAFRQRGQPHAEINLVFRVTLRGLRAGGQPPSAEPHLDFRWLDIDPAALRAARLEPLPLCDLVPAWAQGAPAAHASTVTRAADALLHDCVSC